MGKKGNLEKGKMQKGEKKKKKERYRIVKGDKGKRGKWGKFGNEKGGNWKRKEGSQDTDFFGDIQT